MADLKRILLVDDEETILQTVGGLLERQGYAVDRVNDLVAARNALEQKGYALVITDLCLSEAGSDEGLLVLDCARRSCPSTPVVVLTGYGSPLAESEAFRRGARGFYSKSERLLALVGAVQSFVGPGVPQESGGR